MTAAAKPTGDDIFAARLARIRAGELCHHGVPLVDCIPCGIADYYERCAADGRDSGD